MSSISSPLHTSDFRSSWQIGNGKLENSLKISPKNTDPVLKETEDKAVIISGNNNYDIDETKLQEAMEKLQSLNPEQMKRLPLKTLKNGCLDFSRDGIIQKAPQAAIMAVEIAAMITAGSLCPPLLLTLGLGAIGLATSIVLKNINKKVQMKAQAKAISEIAGIEQKYAQRILELQDKAVKQQKELKKFTTKAMKNDEMNNWATKVLKEAENEDTLAKFNAGKNVKESFGQMIKRNIFGIYQPETVEARGILLELLLKGVMIEDKEVMKFLETQPKERQEAVKEKAEELKKFFIEQQENKSPGDALSNEQKIAVLNNFTSEFLTDEKMKEFSVNVAFKNQPSAGAALYDKETPPELKMQLALAAFTKGIMEQNPEVVTFTQKFAAKCSPDALSFLDDLISQNTIAIQNQTATARQLNEEADSIGFQIAGQTGTNNNITRVEEDLSPEEKRSTLKQFTEDILKDEKMKNFLDTIFKEQPDIIANLHNENLPAENKTSIVIGAFTVGLLNEHPAVIEFNDRITPNYKGKKEEFISQVVSQQADLIKQQKQS